MYRGDLPAKVVDAAQFLNEKPLHRAANLARAIRELTPHNRVDGRLQARVRQYDRRVGSPELERSALQRVRRSSGNHPGRPNASREANHPVDPLLQG
jgi:hypothetical protein